jgi:hypothetical protein
MRGKYLAELLCYSTVHQMKIQINKSCHNCYAVYCPKGLLAVHIEVYIIIIKK